ncbi:CdaR family protein [Anaerocolumna sp. AGMB13025]|uniref:CdaR family protein n=1 Tax=Anaerocolumna sp. AGMB13025 TaxID=3039116 RepID=UPI00241DFB2B|nr:CdaR family protein [Anaerocolumna sp. AGMB13025]WFR58189.1 CdaR family protein [Anaerocolumna sp. AGMB13025]
MKERLTRNLGLKILSLLVAVLVWVVILNVDDPVTTDTFNDIPVTKINENALAHNNKVYEVVSGDTVDVKVKGKRSIIESLKNSDFQAVADLSELSITNAVPIDVTVPKYGDNVEVVKENYTMQVSLEDLVEQQFRIDVVTTGSVPDGYYIKDKTTSPNIIKVSGPESAVDKIKEVVVEVNVSNERESFKKTAVPKVYDKNGTLMDSGNITLNYEEVDASIELLKTKTVNLFIEVKGTPYYGYIYKDPKFEPHQVVIAGTQEELDKVQYIIGEYYINNQKEDIEDKVNIADFIKNDVILIDDNQTAVININIEKMESKDVSLNNNDIELKNIPDGLSAELNNIEPIQVEVMGEDEQLLNVSKYNLKPYIDLSDADIGTKLFNIQFSPTEEGVTIPSTSVSVTISKAAG